MRRQATTATQLLNYAVAAALVTAAALLRWAMPGVLEGTPYLAFYPAVVAAAAFGGLGPGLLAAAGSALCVDLVFDVTPGWMNWRDPVVLGRLAIFLIGGVGTSFIAGLLRRSEQRLRAAFDNAGVGILEVNAHDHFIAANDRVCRILGYRREELLRINVHELTAPEDRARSDQLNARLHEGQLDRLDYEKRYLKRDGTPLWAHVTVSAVRDAAGRWLGAIATVEDISGRKAAEAQLRLQAAALEAAANGIAITDAEGTILWANPAFGAMTGYPLGEVVGRNPRILKSGRQDRTFYAKLWETIRRGEVWHGELVNRRKDGTLYPEEMTITPLRDGQGGISHFIAIKQEITARKSAEAAMAAAKVSAEQAKAAAEQANAAKDHFLAVLSHELRTPLTPVVAMAGILARDERLPVDARDDIEVIRRNVQLEARLIDDLLDVTRIARGKTELDRRPIDLGDAIRRAIEVCQPDIEARKLQFSLDIEHGPYPVEADPARLQQVFWNLLKNAIKFTPEGGRVGIRCHRDERGCVVAEVHDSGVGIEPAVLPRLFKAFEQGGVGTTRQFGGLGLGLAISKAMIEMHGGTIAARSDGKGRGAVFTVELPLLAAAAVAPAQPAPAAPVDQREPGEPKLRILLVEDHGDTARVLSRLLAARGHEVQAAADVATALKLAANSADGGFDLLLSDLGLPDGSGLDLMRALRVRGLTLPGIALSGYGQEEDLRRSREAGFVEHLTKPVDFQRLGEAIAAATAHPTRAHPCHQAAGTNPAPLA